MPPSPRWLRPGISGKRVYNGYGPKSKSSWGVRPRQPTQRSSGPSCNRPPEEALGRPFLSALPPESKSCPGSTGRTFRGIAKSRCRVRTRLTNSKSRLTGTCQGLFYQFGARFPGVPACLFLGATVEQIKGFAGRLGTGRRPRFTGPPTAYIIAASPKTRPEKPSPRTGRLARHLTQSRPGTPRET